MKNDIFKAYDIRGVYPQDIDEDDVEKIAKAYAVFLKPKKIALGRDVRLSGKSLQKAATKGLTEMGVEVIDIGVISTDMLYFAVSKYNLDGGISITASHNPGEYNGMKLVKEGSKPISLETGLAEIRKIATENTFAKADTEGKVTEKEILGDYIDKIMELVDPEKIKPMKVVVNPNFGAAGKAIDIIAKKLGLDLVKLNFEEDGNFPKGRPDPLLEENQKETTNLIKSARADIGVAWDADADRCFFFDEKGRFIPGYYTAAILSKMMLKHNRQEKVIHDPRLVWATRDVIVEAGGAPVMSKVGHSFIKERMRKEDAIFAGENSGHYYFRNFYYCDNGMIPFLLMLEHLSEEEISFSELVDPFFENYPISGELNFEVSDSEKIINALKNKYTDGELDQTDGVSLTFNEWRFNVRTSNTEPLLRLNVEALNRALLEEKTKELTSLIEER